MKHKVLLGSDNFRQRHQHQFGHCDINGVGEQDDNEKILLVLLAERRHWLGHVFVKKSTQTHPIVEMACIQLHNKVHEGYWLCN